MSKNLFDYSSEKILHSKLQKEDTKHSVSSDFAKENYNDNKVNNNAMNVSDDVIKDASDIYEKYKDYSTDELKDEFVSMSKKRLKDGSLSRDKLSSTLSSLSPFLNSQQKKFLDKLIGELDD